MGKAMLKIFALFIVMLLGVAGISFIPTPTEILILLSFVWGFPITTVDKVYLICDERAVSEEIINERCCVIETCMTLEEAKESQGDYDYNTLIWQFDVVNEQLVNGTLLQGETK
jgi:hypothetical protein